MSEDEKPPEPAAEAPKREFSVTPCDEPFEMGELVDVGDPLKVSFVTGSPKPAS